jgi:hypothetical protein
MQGKPSIPNNITWQLNPGWPDPARPHYDKRKIEAIDLVAVPQVIDVRLRRVIAFGQDGVNRLFTVAGLTTLRRTDWVAKAQWELEGQPTHLPPDEEHARSHWCIKFKGELHQDNKFELTKSLRKEDHAVMVRSFDLGRWSCTADWRLCHSILCVSSHSGHQSFALQAAGKRNFSWAKSRFRNRAAHPWRHLFSTDSPSVDIHTLLCNLFKRPLPILAIIDILRAVL